MKRVLLISLMAFLCQGLSAQEKTVKRFNEIREQYVKEYYEVLKKDKNVRHGSYILKSLRGKLKAKGQYEYGEKSGVWTFYTYEGDIEQNYDFTNKELIYHSKESEKVDKHYRLDDGVYKEFAPDRPSVFIGGGATIWFATGSGLKYPRTATRMGIQGTVEIEVVITADGRMINERVIKGIGGGCDEEALRMVKLIPDNWEPALYKGQPVTSKFVMKTVFRLK